LLFLLFRKDNKQNGNNQKYSNSDIKSNHSVVKINHNNYLFFDNNMLNPQAKKTCEPDNLGKSNFIYYNYNVYKKQMQQFTFLFQIC
jgi:hypothetical protein